jgi:hypothetical protein
VSRANQFDFPDVVSLRQAVRHANSARQNGELLNRIKLSRPVQFPNEKYFAFADGQFAHGRHAQIARRVILSQPDGVAVTPKSAADSPRPVPLERGASRSSRTLGAGCDGRFGGARRAALMRTAKSCGPDTPTLVSSFRGKRFP